MLTVRYERLGVRCGDRLLDLGCGGGRHAYEAMRRGATVIAVDADAAEIKDVAAFMSALQIEDEATKQWGGKGTAGVADARCLPFPDACFDRVIAAEVLEHINEDRRVMAELARVLRPGGTMAVTVPRWWPELVNWAISDEYHNIPGGHLRIYRRSALVARLRSAGLEPYASHHAHALHSPFWWLRCAVGVGNDDHLAVRAYHRMLVWDITAATPFTRVPEAILNPVMGKSAVVYLRKGRP
ncbi:MAG TPA: class I SAM-dependent methyltransferase [Acidimicrobiales bacterium]|nr:class I SAM-dependent methyltransferase [Acidimicrobiales bacterium]